MHTALTIPFNFAQFEQITPLNRDTVWTLIVERNRASSGVKRRASAREALEKIFAATFKLANEVGFGAMSLRDLCSETGLSMGGLYGYIDSKEQLADAIEDVVSYATEELPGLLAHLEDPHDHLEALVRGSIYLSEILQPWFYFVYMDSRALSSDQRATAKHSELIIQTLMADIIGRITPRPAGDATLLAGHFLALLQDWYLKRWKYGAAKVQVDDFADSVIGVIRSHLRR